MVREIARLIRIEFDDLENDPMHAREETHLGTFESDGKLSAQGVASEYIEQLEPVKVYYCHDGQIYPQFRLDIERIFPWTKEETK